MPFHRAPARGHPPRRAATVQGNFAAMLADGDGAGIARNARDHLPRAFDGTAGRFRFAADRGADAVNSLFMGSARSGEAINDAGLQAGTQWLLAMPTRQAPVADLAGSLVGTGPAQPGVLANCTVAVPLQAEPAIVAPR